MSPVTRETRSNLIVLSILIVLLAPGMVILFIKKLDPQARKMYLPDPVGDRIAYMSPLETPPGKRRVIPPMTAGFVRDVASRHMNPSGVDLAVALRGALSALPVVSDGSSIELASVNITPDVLELGLMLWDQKIDPDAEANVSVTSTDDTRPPVRATVQTERLLLEQHLRNELGAHGINLQPRQAIWMKLDIRRADLDPQQPLRLTFTLPTLRGNVVSDTLHLVSLDQMRATTPVKLESFPKTSGSY